MDFSNFVTRATGHGPRDYQARIAEHGLPEDSARNDELYEIARRTGVRAVATNAAHLANPRRGRIASVLAAIRARTSLDELDGIIAHIK